MSCEVWGVKCGCNHWVYLAYSFSRTIDVPQFFIVSHGINTLTSTDKSNFLPYDISAVVPENKCDIPYPRAFYT